MSALSWFEIVAPLFALGALLVWATLHRWSIESRNSVAYAPARYVTAWLLPVLAGLTGLSCVALGWLSAYARLRVGLAAPAWFLHGTAPWQAGPMACLLAGLEGVVCAAGLACCVLVTLALGLLLRAGADAGARCLGYYVP